MTAPPPHAHPTPLHPTGPVPSPKSQVPPPRPPDHSSHTYLRRAAPPPCQRKAPALPSRGPASWPPRTRTTRAHSLRRTAAIHAQPHWSCERVRESRGGQDAGGAGLGAGGSGGAGLRALCALCALWGPPGEGSCLARRRNKREMGNLVGYSNGGRKEN